MNTSPTMMLLDTMTSPASVVAVSVKGPPAASAPSLTTHWPLPSAVASPLQKVQANVNAWGQCMGRGTLSRSSSGIHSPLPFAFASPLQM